MSCLFWVTKRIKLSEHDNFNQKCRKPSSADTWQAVQILTQVKKFFCLFKIVKSAWEYKKWGNLFCLIYWDMDTYLPWKTQSQSMFSSLPSTVLFLHLNLKLVKWYKLLMLSAHFMPVSRCFLVSLIQVPVYPKVTPLRTTTKKSSLLYWFLNAVWISLKSLIKTNCYVAV